MAIPKPKAPQLRIDHPLVVDLKGAFSLHEENPPWQCRNIINRVTSNAAAGTYSRPNGRYGREFSFGASSYINFSQILPYVKTPPFSVAVLCKRHAGTSSSGVVFWAGGKNTGPWYSHDMSLGTGASVTSRFNNIFHPAGTGVLPYDTREEYTFLVGVWETTALRKVYVNGLLSGENTGSSDPASRIDTAIAGAAWAGPIQDNPFPGVISLLLVANRAWASVEIAELATDPFAMFRPRRFWVPMGAAAVGNPRYYYAQQ